MSERHLCAVHDDGALRTLGTPEVKEMRIFCSCQLKTPVTMTETERFLVEPGYVPNWEALAQEVTISDSLRKLFDEHIRKMFYARNRKINEDIVRRDAEFTGNSCTGGSQVSEPINVIVGPLPAPEEWKKSLLDALNTERDDMYMANHFLRRHVSLAYGHDMELCMSVDRPTDDGGHVFQFRFRPVKSNEGGTDK